MLEAGPLTEWEADFVKSITKRYPLSDKQILWYKRIIKKYYPTAK
jgi:hypothetical protein